MDLSTAIVLDALVLVVCAGLLLGRGDGSHSHPAVLYLVFHGLVVTARAFAIEGGAPTFLSGYPSQLEALREDEIVRAVLFADVALVAATLGWMSARRRTSRTVHGSSGPRRPWRPLRTRYVQAVALVAVPIGVLTFARYGFVPGRDVRSAATSSYLTFALTWPGLMLVALIYCRGFRPRYVAPLVVYLGIIGLQGSGRFRLIVPLVLLAQIYLDRRGRRWPTPRLAVGILAVALLFFPLKQIGRSVQEGEAIGTIQASAQADIGDALAGRQGDQVILDQLALTLSLSDESGKRFLGRPYLNVLVLPVPRELWEGKPGLADHLFEISRPSRPLARVGGVTTLPGDLYLNFGLPGLLIVMFGLARLSGRLYTAAYDLPYASVGRFAFLLLTCNLVQIYRDGLISVPVFLLVQLLPLMVVLVLHRRSRLVQAEVAPPVRTT